MSDPSRVLKIVFILAIAGILGVVLALVGSSCIVAYVVDMFFSYFV